MRECPDGCSVLGKQCTEPDLRVISAPARWEHLPNPELTLRVSCAFFTKRYECISFFFQKVTMTYKTKSSFCIWPPLKTLLLFSGNGMIFGSCHFLFHHFTVETVRLLSHKV